MAKTLKDENERLQRVLLVGEHLLLTGKSIREIANEISEWFFPISTASDVNLINHEK